ncbi:MULTISPECIES: hypothetical protein [unclassified Anabaena]|uniref:hypothetical protein n=1 Tax=unclassified Anabaena TaxID=2619674 RepID=UPI0014485E61|nr:MULTISPECIES: hypothetical protein [unclassified Anabaena]MTJ07266.1 hypothetical protein [Anabaena sp. UHCC 0204]MTJ55186.1 hypothetical protein [Anabaena sp. UHCC 0253]
MNSYLITGIITAILWQASLCKAWTQPPPCIPRTLPGVSNSLNSFRENNIIVIGKVPNRQYVVVVPGESAKLLNTVRSYVSDAFLAQHRRGAYIYAGGSTKRGEAECLSYVLRSYGLDARVVYFQK